MLDSRSISVVGHDWCGVLAHCQSHRHSAQLASGWRHSSFIGRMKNDRFSSATLLFLAANFAGACDDTRCPPLPCTQGLFVHVRDVAGEPPDSFRGTAELDGTTVEVACPSSPLAPCDGLHFPDNPQHVSLHLESGDGHLVADVAVDPTYRDVNATTDCKTGCLSAQLEVVLE